MPLNENEKEIKKEFAKYKRIVSQLAGVMHDIVEDTIWTDYEQLPELSNDILVAMKDVNEFKALHPFLK